MKKLKCFLWIMNVLMFVLVLGITLITIETSGYFIGEFNRTINANKDYRKVRFGTTRIVIISGQGGLQIALNREIEQPAFVDEEVPVFRPSFGWHIATYPYEHQVSSTTPRNTDGGLWQVVVTEAKFLGFQYAKNTTTGIKPGGTKEVPFVQWRSVTFPLFLLVLAWGLFIFHHEWKRWIIRKMKRRGDILCENCGYDVKSITTGKPCPECGKCAKTTKTAQA